MKRLEVLFFVALALYTTAVMAHHEQRKLRNWMVLVFGLGLTADTLGTLLLCVASAAVWQFTLHSISGLSALFIMAVHFTWGVLAWRGSQTWAVRFEKWSLWAWSLWVVAFVTGIPISPLQRLGWGAAIIVVSYILQIAIAQVWREIKKLRAEK